MGFSGCSTIEARFSVDSQAGLEYRQVGAVELYSKHWNPLFLQSKDERTATVLSDARNEARERFGDDIRLGSVYIKGRWSPLSLVLGFGALGFVERTATVATVFEPSPPPEPPPPPPPEPEPAPEPEHKIVITFEVAPEAEMRDDFGYLRIEYLTNEEARESVSQSLEKRRASQVSVERAIAEVPAGGKIRVHIGRQDLMHANTRWYSYSMSIGSETLLEKGGVEGIPNVRGRDGNWWNTVELPVDDPIFEPLDLSVLDSRADVEYAFTITRVETIVQ